MVSQLKGLAILWLIHIEWFGLGGIFRGHLVQPSCQWQGHQKQEQVVQSPIQPELESFKWWGIHHLSAKTPVLVFYHPL